MIINYLKGDATNPVGPGKKLIAHICNDSGGWGSGFVVALSKKWPEPEQDYREWHKNGTEFKLGATGFIGVEENIGVANMIAQSGYISPTNPVAVDYLALDNCLRKVALVAADNEASVHMPRIGCGLGGGSWDKVEPLIQAAFSPTKVQVYVYDY